VDYVKFIRKFGNRIYHCHIKDVYMSPRTTEAGVFGGHINFGDPRRAWDFRSLGRGSVDFEEIIRALNNVGYQGRSLSNGKTERWTANTARRKRRRS
jgi:sugar phosphate isomerase/epimerase